MTGAEWSRYLGAVTELATIDGKLLEDQRASEQRFQELERERAARAVDAEQSLARLDDRRAVLSDQVRAAARTIEFHVASTSAVPQRARPPHVVLSDLEAVVGRLQKQTALVEGYERAKARMARDDADEAAKREKLAARQAERERKLAEARQHAAAERRRREAAPVARPPAVVPEPAPEPTSRTGLIVIGVVALVIVLIVVLVLVL